MSIQELEYIKLILEIDTTSTVKEIARLIKELRKGRQNDKNTRGN
jgi:hypothetical protein